MLKNTINHIRSNKLFYICFFAILALVLVLRLWRIDEYLTFLSDQGRDAIIIKKIITLEKFTFIGPTTSIGNVYTGPFYYYLVAPFIALSAFDPVGPAIGIALLNTLGLAFCTLIVKKIFGSKTSIVFMLLSGISANLTWQSRFSWNPNPVPYFSFLTIASFYFAQKNNSKRLYALCGILLGLSLQLHYITAILCVVFAIPFIWTVKKQSLLKTNTKNYVIIAIGAIITFTPLILFEIKNKFINTKTLIKARETGEFVAANIAYKDRLQDTFDSFFKHLFFTNSTQHFNLFIVLTIIAIFAFCIYKKNKLVNNYIIWSVALISAFIFAFAKLETQRHAHYYNAIILFGYLLIAQTAVAAFSLARNKITKLLIGALLAICIVLYANIQFADFHFFTDSPRTITQVSHARDVAKYIVNNVTNKDYQVVGLPFYETENHYRYFLDFFNKRPMPADTLGDPGELFVICHSKTVKECEIPGNPQWQLADFQNRHKNWKIISSKQIQEVIVVKIVR